MSDKKEKKKQTRRSKEKFPSLRRNFNSKVRQEYIDYDYVDGRTATDGTQLRALNDEEKQFLEDFNSEYYNASVGRQSDEGKNNRFHKSSKLVKERQDANNERHRDLYGRVRNKVGATKLLNYEDSVTYIDAYSQRDNHINSYEDAMIDYLDNAESSQGSPDDTDENS